MLGTAVFFSVIAVSNAADQKTVVLPPNIEVSAPDSSVPENCAEYSGVWAGSWRESDRPAQLWVQEISSDCIATITYAWGYGRLSANPEAGYRTLEAEIKGKKMSFEIGRTEFWIKRKDDRLKIRVSARTYDARSTFKKREN